MRNLEKKLSVQVKLCVKVNKKHLATCQFLFLREGFTQIIVFFVFIKQNKNKTPKISPTNLN